MTTTNAAEQSGASRGGLPARHPPRRDDHPRETTSGEGVVLSSKRAEQMLADWKESLDRTKRSPAHLGELAPRDKSGSALFTEMPRDVLGKPAPPPAGVNPPLVLPDGPRRRKVKTAHLLPDGHGGRGVKADSHYPMRPGGCLLKFILGTPVSGMAAST